MIEERRHYVRAERTVRVFRGGNGSFSFTRDGAGKGRASTCLAREPLQKAVDLLNASVARLAVATVDWDDRYQSERDAAIADVVSHGAKLFDAIAADDASKANTRAVLNGASFLETFADLHIPWEWLYLGDRGGPSDLRQFLGASTTVGYNVCIRTPSETEDPNDSWLRYARVPIGPGLRINLAQDMKLKSAAVGTERDAIAGRGHTISPLRILTTDRRKELDAFGKFMRDEHDVAHFNTHADGRRDTAHPKLTVSNDFPVSTADIANLRPFYPDAVVVLNCCNGLALHWGPEETLAMAFLENGGETIVATTSQVEDSYATRFIGKMYESLYDGACVGDALISARRNMIAETGNPGCLAYGIIGSYLKRIVDRDAA